MLKKQLLLAVLLMFFISAYAQTKYPYYYEVISNKDTTLNYIFGFYPAGSLHYYESKDYPSYTSINAAIFNKAPKDSLKWNGYKVNILLKSGKLICNYVPDSKTGLYVCNYTVGIDSTHYQVYCFHTKFTKDDIDKVWLVMSDDEIFGLTYDKNE